MKTTTESDPTEVHATIKLGIDAHAKWFWGGRHPDEDPTRPLERKRHYRTPKENPPRDMAASFPGPDFLHAFAFGNVGRVALPA